VNTTPRGCSRAVLFGGLPNFRRSETSVVLGILQRNLARFGAALQHQDFRTMWYGVLAAQAAAWALIVARGWLVFDMTGSSMSVGIVTFAAMAPMFFMPPIAGVLADKWDRRSLLAGSYAINLFQNLVLAILALSGVSQRAASSAAAGHAGHESATAPGEGASVDRPGATQAMLGGGGHDHGFNVEATGFATLMMGVGTGALFGSLYVGGIVGSLGGIMSFMNLANGMLGTQFPASAILFVNGMLFVGIMLVSIAFALPRDVYVRGMPAGRAAAA